MTEEERPVPQVRRCIFCKRPIFDADAVTDESIPYAVAHTECAWPEDGRTPDEGPDE